MIGKMNKLKEGVSVASVKQDWVKKAISLAVAATLTAGAANALANGDKDNVSWYSDTVSETAKSINWDKDGNMIRFSDTLSSMIDENDIDLTPDQIKEALWRDIWRWDKWIYEDWVLYLKKEWSWQVVSIQEDFADDEELEYAKGVEDADTDSGSDERETFVRAHATDDDVTVRQRFQELNMEISGWLGFVDMNNNSLLTADIWAAYLHPSEMWGVYGEYQNVERGEANRWMFWWAFQVLDNSVTNVTTQFLERNIEVDWHVGETSRFSIWAEHEQYIGDDIFDSVGGRFVYRTTDSEEVWQDWTYKYHWEGADVNRLEWTTGVFYPGRDDIKWTLSAGYERTEYDITGGADDSLTWSLEWVYQPRDDVRTSFSYRHSNTVDTMNVSAWWHFAPDQRLTADYTHYNYDDAGPENTIMFNYTIWQWGGFGELRNPWGDVGLDFENLNAVQWVDGFDLDGRKYVEEIEEKEDPEGLKADDFILSDDVWSGSVEGDWKELSDVRWWSGEYSAMFENWETEINTDKWNWRIDGDKLTFNPNDDTEGDDTVSLVIENWEWKTTTVESTVRNIDTTEEWVPEIIDPEEDGWTYWFEPGERTQIKVEFDRDPSDFDVDLVWWFEWAYQWTAIDWNTMRIEIIATDTDQTTWQLILQNSSGDTFEFNLATREN